MRILIVIMAICMIGATYSYDKVDDSVVAITKTVDYVDNRTLEDIDGDIEDLRNQITHSEERAVELNAEIAQLEKHKVEASKLGVK